jgi:TonB family protein
MIKYIAISTCVHALAVLALRLDSSKTVNKEPPTEIEIIETFKLKRAGGAGSGSSSTEQVRINEELQKPLLEQKEFKYAHYIARLTEAIRTDWLAKVNAYLKHNKHRGTFTTLVWVILDRTGKVQRTRLVKSSGVEALDTLALQAWQNVYVPNVPSSLIDNDGYARILYKFTVQN